MNRQRASWVAVLSVAAITLLSWLRAAMPPHRRPGTAAQHGRACECGDQVLP